MEDTLLQMASRVCSTNQAPVNVRVKELPTHVGINVVGWTEVILACTSIVWACRTMCSVDSHIICFNPDRPLHTSLHTQNTNKLEFFKL